MLLTHTTPPRLDAPAYTAPGDGTMIHRYLGTGFAEDFLDEARRFALPALADQDWRVTDRFGKHANGLTTLRLPMHNAFHKVCVEVSCDEVGRPALHPRRVASAGFVVRKGTPDAPKIWLLDNGAALGWRTPDKPDAEPDHRRRLVNAGLLPGRSPKGRYSGEETHPLRALLVDAPAVPGAGRARKRTLLHGLLPLSGKAPVETLPAENDAPETQSGRMGELEWPLGSWNGEAGDTAPTLERFEWQQADGVLIRDGRPSRAFVQLLPVLLARYHVTDDTTANSALRDALSALALRTSVPFPQEGEGGDIDLSTSTYRQGLLTYLSQNTDALVDYARAQEPPFLEDASYSPPKLPGLSPEDLYISEAAAAQLRLLLVRRGEAAEAALNDLIRLPRYSQGENEVFFVRPFLRYLDDCGCERLVWGPPSQPFRVTSPFDPEATPPNVIQMPDLDDIKRGVAKGVTLITPKSIVEQMDKIKPDMTFEEKKALPIPLCLSFAISFSIPAITICAMIILMVLIFILNLFFQWLPWVFLRLSLKCK